MEASAPGKAGPGNGGPLLQKLFKHFQYLPLTLDAIQHRLNERDCFLCGKAVLAERLIILLYLIPGKKLLSSAEV